MTDQETLIGGKVAAALKDSANHHAAFNQRVGEDIAPDAGVLATGNDNAELRGAGRGGLPLVMVSSKGSGPSPTER